MRFLCKNCGAQSPGDLSEVAVRDGALVFTCKACGASATLVENHEPGAAATPVSPAGARAGKGIVEPDEAELVELGQATISRMLGRKVRIVDDSSPDPAPGSASESDRPSGSIASAVEPFGPVPADGTPVAPLLVREAESTEKTVEPVFLVPESHAGRSRFVAGVIAGLVLAAVVTFALLEARQPVPSDGGHAPQASAAKVPPVGNEATGRDVPLQALRDDPSARDGEGPRSVVAPRSTVPAATAPVPAHARGAEPRPATSVRDPRAVEAAPPPAPYPSVGPAADHLDEAFRRVRPGVRMCSLQEKRRNAEAKLGDESVTVTFVPSGEVQRVSFASSGFEATPLGECLAVELRKARVEPFSGEPVAVKRVLSLGDPGVPAN